MSEKKIKKIPGYVTLLTDFGTEDGYVGALKGVLLNGKPDIQILDVSHDIQSFNIKQAAYSLINYAFYFPPGTIHLVVVDPGVGTQREGLVVQAADYFFIGPNNGVFSYIYHFTDYKAYHIREELFGENVSTTFHGRDIFAPAAIRLIQGEPLENFCNPLEEVVSVFESFLDVGGGEYRLKIIHVDHFGNLILNFTLHDWQAIGSPTGLQIQINNDFLLGIKRTFADGPPEQIVMTWDSRGFLQIAQNCGHAAETLKMKEGDSVKLKIIHTSTNHA